MPPTSKKSTEGKAIETVEVPALAAEPDEGSVEPTPSVVTIDHPKYGMVTLEELEQILTAEIEAKRADVEAAEQAQESLKPAPICMTCFPEGWDSKNAVGQDGVGCEHGSYARKSSKPEGITFPESWKSSKPELDK